MDFLLSEDINKVLLAFKNILKNNEISYNDNFFSLGGDSLSAVKVCTMLGKDYEINMMDVYTHQTAEQLGLTLAERRRDNSPEYIARKLLYMLSPSILDMKSVKKDLIKYEFKINKLLSNSNITLNSNQRFKNILLTGATGFLGGFLLKDLLVKTDSIIYVLVREKKTFKTTKLNPDEIHKHISSLEESSKIFQTLELFTKSHEIYIKDAEVLNAMESDKLISDRIRIIKGDFTLKNLGLNEYEYLNLSNEIDVIIHAGANTSHFGPWENFYIPNVIGTKNMLDFAILNKKKIFNHISTIGVFVKNSSKSFFTEFDQPVAQNNDAFPNYYTLSKALAENMVENAMKLGITINIFRLGLLKPESILGNWEKQSKKSAFYNLIFELNKVKVLPHFIHKNISFTSVDIASKAIVELINSASSKNNKFHIINPNFISIYQLCNILKTNNVEINTASADNFISQMNSLCKEDSVSQALYNITGYIERMFPPKGMPIISSKYTNMILKAKRITWPSANNNIF